MLEQQSRQPEASSSSHPRRPLWKRLLIEGGALLLVGALAFGARWFWDKVYLPGQAVGQVGEQTITRGQYEVALELRMADFITRLQTRINRQRAELPSAPSGPERTMAEQRIQQDERSLQDAVGIYNQILYGPLHYTTLDLMIEQELIVQGAQRENIAVTDQEVYGTLANLLTSPPEVDPLELPVTPTLMLQAAAGPLLSLPEAQKIVNETLSQRYEDFVRELKESFNVTVNISREDFVDHVVQQQRIQLLREAVAFKLTPVQEPRPTLQALSEIMILTISRPVTATEDMLESIYAQRKVEADAAYGQLKAGADFATVGAPYEIEADESYEPVWVAVDELFPEQAEALRTQPLGEIGQPVKSEAGWFIFKVHARAMRPDPKKLQATRIAAYYDWLERQRNDLKTQRFPEPTPRPDGPLVLPEYRNADGDDHDHSQHDHGPLETPALPTSP